MAKKMKRKSGLAGYGFEHDGTGHHARLRKLHAGGGDGASSSRRPRKRRKNSGKRRKKSGNAAKTKKRSAFMKRLQSAVAGARDQIRSFGRRKKEQPQKLVTEETLRNHMALKCVRRCSH
ncbi:MAG TPA: hypothetical protein VJN18_02740 [Polyangiaceae bacterium]|nr:hypothetical protein [Polyangiaceae bacterium]